MFINAKHTTILVAHKNNSIQETILEEEKGRNEVI
jgi:hypothetical protein